MYYVLVVVLTDTQPVLRVQDQLPSRPRDKLTSDETYPTPLAMRLLKLQLQQGLSAD
jgi:hypothetical protein